MATQIQIQDARNKWQMLMGMLRYTAEKHNWAVGLADTFVTDVDDTDDVEANIKQACNVMSEGLSDTIHHCELAKSWLEGAIATEVVDGKK